MSEALLHCLNVTGHDMVSIDAIRQSHFYIIAACVQLAEGGLPLYDQTGRAFLKALFRLGCTLRNSFFNLVFPENLQPKSHA